MSARMGWEGAASELRASGAKVLAHALINGISEAEAEGHPLTQVQQVSLATMTVMAYDEILEGCRNLEFEANVLLPHADAIRAMGKEETS